MPTISINKRHLADKLESTISDDLISKNLFDFGLELDDIVVEGGETIYKIETPANRYDLLCLEGLANALKPYNNKGLFPEITVQTGDYVVVQENTEYRPHIACAVIKGIEFDHEMYDSFIDYQDKLHMTLGRNRSIVAIGTHDLNTFEFPVSYKADEPEKISFVPLNQNKCMNGIEIYELYSKDNNMKHYTKLLQEKYSFFVDKNNEVLSLPPVINSNKTKISLQTKNIFVEVTGTDLNKVNIALKMILYCFRGKSITQVEIKAADEPQKTVNDSDENKEKINYSKEVNVVDSKVNKINLSDNPNEFCNERAEGIEEEVVEKRFTPAFNNYTYEFGLFDIQDALGIKIYPDKIKHLLEKMMHKVRIHNDKIIVSVSDVRSDVIHKVDIIEDVAIAFGYNNLSRRNPLLYTIGQELPINKFCNKLREEMAQMGYNEVLTLSLLSKRDSLGEEGYVTLENPKSSECEVMRNMLLPGLLKTAHINQHTGVPMKIFEISDVVDQNGNNSRRLCVCFVNKVDNLEIVIGTCSLLMQKLKLNFKYSEKEIGHYFEKRSCEVVVGSKVVGTLGVVHCDVCVNFRVPFAVSSFEIDMNQLFALYTENKI